MPVTPDAIFNAEVLEVGVNGPGSANTLFVATGVVGVNFAGTQQDWTRDEVVFIVPAEGTTTAVENGGQALEVGQFEDSVVAAYPATFSSTSGDDVGWGVDEVDTITVGGGASDRVQVTAKVAVRNPNGVLLRLGYNVSILAHK